MNEPTLSQTPSSPFAQSTPELDFGTIDEQLARTKPWVRYASTLGFLMGALTMVSVFSGSLVTVLQVIFALIFALLAYVIPSILLWNYGSRIGEYLRGSNATSFSEALAAQKTFWKYLGIMVLIIVVVYGTIVVFGVLLFTISAMR